MAGTARTEPVEAAGQVDRGRLVEHPLVERVLDRDPERLLHALDEQGVVRRCRVATVHRGPDQTENDVTADQQR
ncbi:hypothetical protein LWC34_47040 [Kibdelosporangium philippinense]|uniref:Uncharacterized protein n=1 Tax=Kibdelosporangium philippinense TaxID=211113 RepID=A0ABS8ZRF8_9PSEU|nr:hypothetical protein [Kibdelosporangium philippinense]MCE7010311.1 hypothetical protein [Kibdelosporangium philippinense]